MSQSALCLQVNGTLAHLPLHLAGGLVHVYFSGSGAVLQTSTGLLVSYDWRHHVSVMVPETYAGALCGLGGDFNGDPRDDFRAPNGSLLHDAEAFAFSWKDPASPAGCWVTGPAPLCPHDTGGRYQSLAFCGLLAARDGPFQACDEPAEAQVHMENCVHDLCATGGSRQILCEVLGSYAQQCQRHGLPVQPWRHLVDCGEWHLQGQCGRCAGWHSSAGCFQNPILPVCIMNVLRVAISGLAPSGT